MNGIKKISLLVLPFLLVAMAFVNNSCSVHYGFKDVSIPDSIRTIKVNLIENRATYINPQLSPQLSDKLRQKIVSQTKLKQTNGDNADWEISGTITDYSFSTSGISNQQTSTSRLTVGVHITINKIKEDKTEEYDVSRNFDFPSSQSLQQAEASLLTEMVRGLSDDIFNRLFSNWN
ncbi:MAG: LptE family protein [Bacteroidota bacterium]|nr:LptE family protein [Bacteroidota bacterium]